MPGRTPEGDALTGLVLSVFELNGEFLEAAKMISAPHSLTPAQWQVIGAVLEQPFTVSDIARKIGLGLTRQSVQRVANDVVSRGWAEWQENPHHKKAKLLSPTARGVAAVREMAVEQHAWANAVGGQIGSKQLAEFHETLAQIVAASRAYRAADGGGLAG